jgi:hypothetical protein
MSSSLQAIWELMQKAQAEGVLGEDFKLPSTAREPAPQAEVEEITPEPGFVVKTANEETGLKVFINICGSEKVTFSILACTLLVNEILKQSRTLKSLLILAMSTS